MLNKLGRLGLAAHNGGIVLRLRVKKLIPGTTLRRVTIFRVVSLSMVASLAGVAVMSRNPATGSLWLVGAIVGPPLVVWRFRRKMLRLRTVTFVAAVVAALLAAVLFGT